MKNMVSVLIFVKNEAIHIKRCINSARTISDKIYVVDSDSSDGTIEIARQMGVSVFNYSAKHFSEKINWAIDNIPIDTPWVMRIDADEVLHDKWVGDSKFAENICDNRLNGIYVRRQLWFMGKWIRHGGVYPKWSMRLWRTGSARCESRDLDEHMLLNDGKCSYLENDIIDNPLTDISVWIQKHNRYSTLEAALAVKRCNDNELAGKLFGNHVERVRWVKKNIYYPMPLFLRPLLYFIYRYIICFGFLDGVYGLLFNFLHAFWYRLVVDIKIREMSNKH
jgi:glycosyltransferase involved in cell wall biosynthesis